MIARPTQCLGTLARELGTETSTCALNSERRDEIGDLARSFDTMVDLEHIFAVSFERWGADGLARYSALIEAALRAIAARPTGPTTRDRSSLLPGLRSLHLRNVRNAGAVHQPAHLIYYRSATDGALEIVRVLQERVDPSLHLEPPMRHGPKRRSH
ncbi:MAG: hypothetical protein ACREBE_27830 [bacterium]